MRTDYAYFKYIFCLKFFPLHTKISYVHTSWKECHFGQSGIFFKEINRLKLIYTSL